MSNSKNAIVFITNLHLWSIDKGKGGKAFYNCILGYINSDWDIYLITTGGNVPKEFEGKINLFEKHFPKLDNAIENSIRPISILAKLYKRLLLNIFYTNTAKSIFSENSNKKFIVYAYEVDAVSAAKAISLKYNVPLVTRFQGTILSKLKFNFINKLRQSVHFNALKTKADLVVMTNDGTQGDAVLKKLRNESNKIVFWRNGVDWVNINDLPNRESLRSKFEFKDDNIFVTVSRLIGWKRVHLAIEAFKELVNSLPNSKLVIIGDGEEMNNLKQLANKLNIDSRVIFVGAIEQSMVTKYLFASDYFLSLYDLSNLGNPIMEAMMVGMPIITIDVGDTKELIRNNYNGILLPNNNFHLISESMRLLIQNKDLAIKISEGARETAEKEFWSWSKRMENEVKEVKALFNN